MISERQAKKYCGEDISLIENYVEAVNDKTRTWVIHHRLEIQGPFTNSPELLKKCGLYYGVPAAQLVFMTRTEHQRLHNLNMSEKTNQKRSNTLTGRPRSEETKRKQSEAMSGEKHPNFGKHRSEETRRRMSEAHKKYWMKRKASASE